MTDTKIANRDDGRRIRYIVAHNYDYCKKDPSDQKVIIRMGVFQKLLKAEANRRVRMCNLQSAKDCASVKTSLATVRARAQEWGKEREGDALI